VLLDARPDPVADDARSNSGVAEQRFASVVARALAAYRDVGFHVARGLLDDAACAALRTAATHLGTAGTAPLAPVMNPHLADEAFLAALCHPGIVAILESLVGHPVSGLQSQYLPCLPGTPGFATHQDNHYVEADRDSFASAWAALDDVYSANGALIVYPGSQRLPLLTPEAVPGAHPHATQAFNALRRRVVVPPGYAPATLEVPRGAVIFLHGHLLHGSNENHSSRPRAALLCTYIRRGASFRRGNSAQRCEIDVHRQRSAS